MNRQIQLWLGVAAMGMAVAAPAAERAPSPAAGAEAQAPTAHEPRFSDKALWPHYTGKEEYAKQAWPKARVLVWTGASGRFEDAGKWTENGRPAKRAPDRDTDVVFPEADKPYTVNANGSECRHLTIERNAQVIGRNREIGILGSCWVKEGGTIFGPRISGDRSTFFRMDVRAGSFGRAHYDNKARGPFPHVIHDKMSLAKYRGASVEFIGTMGVQDEIYIAVGRMIIGPDSEFRTNVKTGNGTMELFEGATLELQSGAAVVDHRGTALCNVAFHTGATLQAGSPDRPITRDVFLRPDPMIQKREPRAFFAAGSRIRVFSADPKKARLVFESNVPGVKLPEGLGLELSLGGEMQLNGVVFDQIAAGGIRLSDPAARKQWAHVVFGPNNAAQGEALFSKVRLEELGQRWNTRGIKYRQLVAPHLKEMKKLEGEAPQAPGE